MQNLFGVRKSPKIWVLGLSSIHLIDETILSINVKQDRIRYIGRPSAASTATGIAAKHKREQQSIIDNAFAK